MASLDFSMLSHAQRKRQFSFLRVFSWLLLANVVTATIVALTRNDERFAAQILAGEFIGLMLLLPAVGWSLAAKATAGRALLPRLIIDVRRKREISELAAFAKHNQLSKERSFIPKQELGALFRFGHSQKGYDVLRGTIAELPYRLFKYSYRVGDYDTLDWPLEATVVAVTLPRALPHIVIDSLLNGASRGLHSGLPVHFDERQRLQLEGDFNTYFRLYALQGYHIPALSIMAPDVMLALMESGIQSDIEIVGNTLYFYWTTTEQTAETYQTFYQTTELVLSEVKRKLITADIYADAQQAALYSSPDAASYARLSTNRFLPRIAHVMRRLNSLATWIGLLLLIVLPEVISPSIPVFSAIIHAFSIAAYVVIVLVLFGLPLIYYGLALGKALTAARTERLIKNLRKHYATRPATL